MPPNLAFTRLTCLGKLFPNTTDNVKIVRKTQHRQPVMQNHAQNPCKTEFAEKQTKTRFFPEMAALEPLEPRATLVAMVVILTLLAGPFLIKRV